MMSDWHFFWLCALIIAVYFILWWVTSIEPRARYTILRERGLRPIYAELESAITDLSNRILIPDAIAVSQSIERRLDHMADWIRKSMGEPAVAKFQGGAAERGFIAIGNAPQDRLHNIIAPAVAELQKRQRNLEELMESDKWDSAAPKPWKVWERVERYQ